jgi:hypothetical protein
MLEDKIYQYNQMLEASPVKTETLPHNAHDVDIFANYLITFKDKTVAVSCLEKLKTLGVCYCEEYEVLRAEAGAYTSMLELIKQAQKNLEPQITKVKAYESLRKDFAEFLKGAVVYTQGEIQSRSFPENIEVFKMMDEIQAKVMENYAEITGDVLKKIPLESDQRMFCQEDCTLTYIQLLAENGALVHVMPWLLEFINTEIFQFNKSEIMPIFEENYNQLSKDYAEICKLSDDGLIEMVRQNCSLDSFNDMEKDEMLDFAKEYMETIKISLQHFKTLCDTE